MGPGRYTLSAPDEPGAKLCQYGRFGYELTFRSERIVRPEIRRGHSRTRADLAMAWAHAARELKAVVERHGPDSVAVFASPELSTRSCGLPRASPGRAWERQRRSLSMLATARRATA